MTTTYIIFLTIFSTVSCRRFLQVCTAKSGLNLLIQSNYLKEVFNFKTYEIVNIMICKDDKGYTNYSINKNSKKKYLFTQSGLIYIKNFK